MLQLRARPSARLWGSIRLASQLSQRSIDDPSVKTVTTPTTTEGGHKPPSLLSRLSDRTKSRIRRSSDTELKNPDAHVRAAAAEDRKPRPRAISFVSARSAQKRDDAAEKWFTDIRQLDIDNVDQPDEHKSLSHKKRVRSNFPKQHEMRPRTDLNVLFAHPTARSTASSRLQTKRELGGDYANYLPKGYTDVDPYRLPVEYARLVLGRNKHVPLNAQTGALNIIEEVTRGRTARQVA